MSVPHCWRALRPPALLLIGSLATACIGSDHCNPASPSAADRGGQQVWVSPNVASKDFLNLFLAPDEWANARAKITTIGFFDAQLRYESCDLCGPNTLQNFLGVVPGGAFAWLSRHGLQIAVEAGAVKTWDCTADTNRLFAEEALRNVKAHGGTVNFVALDEPFTAAASGCRYSVDQTAQVVKKYIDLVTAAHSEVQIGLIEPYPFFRIPQLESILDAVANAGVRLPFFHLDFDPRFEGIDFAADIQELQRYLRQHHIPFGVILIGADGDSSAGAVNGAIAMAMSLSAMIGVRSQDHVLFESWLDVPSARGQRDLRFFPDNLPEANPATMMGMVNFVLETVQ